ncbi:glycosyltransferase family 87 protein [Plastoroseomonas arctica]|uniref:DUF2029 domain-containing protein n=1 Tax=Plastoroseomonas arctica TaxID=1509237 RepID=A0AAF1K9M5_9PROT|nr:glycosyltransferase family 87 protein [Plastoroseomonas arctica]MBR0657561.1 DUF2029 domain-containing protein [Plastoroseomonas arctica]
MDAGPLAATAEPRGLLAPPRGRLYGATYLILALIFLGLFVEHLVEGDAVQRGDRDFLSFYAASRLAWDGLAASVWNRAAHQAAEIAYLGAQRGYFAFYYPPTYLLTCLPLGALPLFGAYLAWVAATVALLAGVLRRAGLGWIGIAVLVISPAGILTITTGQNAFLTTGLFVLAGLTLAGRPGVAGACFGLLTMKPQLGLMVVPALIAARRWGVLAWASLATLAFAGAAALVLGSESWSAFLAGRPAAQSGMEVELQIFKMQSVFAVARQLGAGTTLAYAAQAGAAVAVVVALWPALRRRPGGMPEVAAMAAGGLLMTPFLQFYDLMLLTLPMIALAQSASADGVLPGERGGVLLLLLGPGLSYASGWAFGVSFGPLLAVLAVAMLRRRILRPEAITPPAPG